MFTSLKADLWKDIELLHLRFFYSSHFSLCTNVLIEQFLQEDIQLRHLANEKTQFMFC